MKQLALLVAFAACGGSKEGSVKVEHQEVTIEQVKDRVEREHDERATTDEIEGVTDAAGRAYLAKLAQVGDTACACKTEECGKSVIESWATWQMTSGNNYTLSAADRTREEKMLQRVFSCGAFSAPEKRDDIAKLKRESKAARAKVLALVADSYDGESDDTKAAIRAMKRDLKALCECTTSACVDGLQPKFAEPPIVTTKREVELLRDLITGVMTCGTAAIGDAISID